MATSDCHGNFCFTEEAIGYGCSVESLSLTADLRAQYRCAMVWTREASPGSKPETQRYGE
jgi:hypothetical protein